MANYIYGRGARAADLQTKYGCGSREMTWRPLMSMVKPSLGCRPDWPELRGVHYQR